MAENKSTKGLEELESVPEQIRDQDKEEEKGDARLLQDSADALPSFDEDIVDPGYEQLFYDTADDADDELDTGDDDDNDDEDIQPLSIKKAKTSLDTDQEIIAHTHGNVKWADSLARADESPAEAGQTAHIASKNDLPRAPTPYPEPHSANQFSDLLHPSPPLRHHKGSQIFGVMNSDSDSDHSMMSKTGGDQDTLHGQTKVHAVDNSEISNTYLTSTQRGKKPETRGSQNKPAGEEQGLSVDIGKSTEIFTSSEDQVLKPNSSNLQKAHAVLGYSNEDKIIPKQIMAELVTSPKSSHEKKSLRKFFRRKGSKQPKTPPHSSPSSSGKVAGRRTISAPTLIDASPNAKALLNSASTLNDDPLGAKGVVNYSRTIALRSSSDASNGSPVGLGRLGTASHASNVFLGPITSPEGLTDMARDIPANPNTSFVRDHSGASAVRENQAGDEHDTEKHANASDGDSFDPSDYSGDENSVQQAVVVPIVFRGKAKSVDIRPPRGTITATSSNRSGLGTGIASGTARLTDREAEALGVEDADRYLSNAMTPQNRSTRTTLDDPFTDPSYRNLLAKPVNEIAAKEMARLKAVREAGSMGGGLMERMNALRTKNEAKPVVESTGVAIAGPRMITANSLLPKMRANKKRPEKGRQQEEGEEEVERKVQADVERGLHEENEIHATIKAKLAAKAAANGGVYGAGIPRIDYGPPSRGTALGGCSPTDEERAYARALAARGAAGPSGGRVQNSGDNTTARGHFEGC